MLLYFSDYFRKIYKVENDYFLYMKKANATPIILALFAIAALAVVTLTFKGGITSSVVVEPLEQERLVRNVEIEGVECLDSDGGFNLFEAGKAMLLVYGEQVVEMADRCLYEEVEIAETVCRGDEAVQIESSCPIIEFPEGARQAKCIEDSGSARCESCADHDMADCDGKCC